MRKKRLALNTASSLVFQITTLFSGFILPRLFIGTYGSSVNGLVSSIGQFLHIIAFLELGVGAVVQSALYKPLAQKDTSLVSKIYASADKFFKRLATVLLVYVVLLMLLYPHIVSDDFEWMYTATLIAAISISSFAQYYFGIVNQLLLSADQRGYVQYTAHTLTLIINTIVCVFLIQGGASIHTVKLSTSLIYLLRPLALRLYVNRHYSIDRKIQYQGEPIKQKWNGVAQHVASVILNGIDVVVLTLFSALANVSVYSVYNLVISGVKQLLISATNGIHALIGELWAKQETQTLHRTFSWVEWIIHTASVLVFGCTAVLLVPFISVYTSGVTDVNYIQPVFGVLLTIAHAGHCLRLPYSMMILAAGHYKQTQRNYVVAALLNVVISIILVKPMGLIGVAIGTVVALFYQTIWMAHYSAQHLVRRPLKSFLAQLGVDVLTVGIGAIATSWIRLGEISYLSWIIMGVKVFVIWLAVIFVLNAVFYKDNLQGLSRKMRASVRIRRA